MRLRPFILESLAVAVLIASPTAFAKVQGDGDGKAETARKTLVPLSDEEAAAVQQLRLAGKHQEAIDLLEGSPSVESGDARAQGLLGLVYFDAGMIGEAKWIATQFPSYYGNAVEPELLNGIVWLEQKRVSKALSHFRKALANDPVNLEAQLGLALCESLMVPSLESTKRILTFDLHRDEIPKRQLNDAIRMICSVTAQSRVAVGNHSEKTLKLIRTVVELAPDDVNNIIALGEELLALNKLDEVRELAADIYENQSDLMQEAQYFLAAAERKSGNLDKALELANEALVLSGRQHARALQLAAEICMEQGNLDAARLHLDRLVIVNPNLIDGHILFVRYFLDRYHNLTKGRDLDQLTIDERAKLKADQREYLRQAENEGLRAAELDRYSLPNLELLKEVYSLNDPDDYAAKEADRKTMVIIGNKREKRRLATIKKQG